MSKQLSAILDIFINPVSRGALALALSLWAGQLPAVTTQAYRYGNVEIVAGGFVPGIIYHPTEPGLAYLRTDMGGAYRLNGVTRRWEPITDLFSANDWNMYGIESVALDPTDPDRVYLACGTYAYNNWSGNAAVMRSTDRGVTWARTNLPFKLGANESGRGSGERMVVDPASPNILFLGTRQTGLWKSLDQGATWAQVAGFPAVTTPFDEGLTFVAVIPGTGTPSQTLYVGVANAGTANLYRSTNGGTNWAAVPGAPTGMLPYRWQRASNGNLYFTYNNGPGPNGITGGAVWRYVPGTGVWTQLLNNGANQGGFGGLAIDPQNDNTLMTATIDRWWPRDEIYRSTDGGANWRIISANESRSAAESPWLRWGGTDANLSTGNWVSALAIDPFNRDRVIYATGATVWGSDNIRANDTLGRVDWVIRGQGVEETAVQDLASPATGPMLYSAIGDLGGFVHQNVAVAPAMLNPIYVTCTGIDFAGQLPSKVARVRSADPALVAVSTDSGATWTESVVLPVAGNGGRIAVSAAGTSMVWSRAGQPHRSVNNGASWTACAGITAVDVRADRVTDGVYYAVQGGNLYRSTDGGQNFALRFTGAGDRRLDTVPGLAGHVWVTGGSGLRYTMDGGATFNTAAEVQNADVVGFGMAAPAGTYPAVFIAGTIGGVYGVYRSDDRGASWIRVNDNLHQWGWIAQRLIGDPRVYGRYYLATNGRGIIQGDILAALATATRTSTRTATRTATTTATRTATATATRTATTTPTRSASPTATPTGSPSTSPTRSSTPSHSPSATLTRSTSSTPSPTNTPSISPTPSLTATLGVNSPTASPTLTTTRTVSPLASPTASLSVTATRTASPLASPTASLSVTATRTTSPLASPTASPSVTATRTVSPLASPTASPSVTATHSTSPTPSLTGTHSTSTTPSLTGTLGAGSPTVSPSLTASPTASPTLTATRTVSPLASPTASPTMTATRTVSPLASPTASPTLTATRTPSTSTTASPTRTLGVSSPTVSPSATVTPAPAVDGPLVIEEAVPLPNPNPRQLALKLQGRAETLSLRLYSSNWARVVSVDGQAAGPGWVRLDLGRALVDLPNGTYYYSVEATRRGVRSQSRKGVLVILR